MKAILKREWGYILMILGLVILTFMQVSTFRFGFFSAYDDSYFLLKLQEAYDMSCITGKSQWNLIAVHWFPYLDLTSKASSFLASSILIWGTIIAMTITSCLLFERKRVIKYLALSWFFMFSLGGILSYVPMQTAVLIWALCAYLLHYKSEVVWKKSIYAVVCGICLGFGLFIIIPSALVLLACIAMLIILSQWGDWKKMMLYLASGIAGVLLTCMYIHVVVCPLGDILDAMLFTATYIGKSGYHYNGASFIAQYALFFRDCIFVVIAFVGAYWLSERIGKKWLGCIVYVLLMLIYNHYQAKPEITPAMIMMSVPLIPFLFDRLPEFKWSDLRKADSWFFLFIFLFPFIASFGTNTALGGRIAYFVGAWLFLWFDYESRYPQKHFARVFAVVVLLFALPIANVVREYLNRDDTYHFTRGKANFSDIAITEKQKQYFDNVYDILEDYNFQPKKSTILTACYDYCCLYVFDAVNAANYYQVQNFAYFPKEKMSEPDFVFMCPWDSIVMAEDLRAMPWGWPEEFDCYYVGTPEPDNASWVLNPSMEVRTLYCRKSLKNKE